MQKISRFTYLLPALLFTACVQIPTAPSVMVLPGTDKNFDQFRSDDHLCKQYASQQGGGQTTRQASISSGVESAAVGSALGAVAGAAIGDGRGAAIGAGSGLLAGSLTGSEAARTSRSISQERYDISYIQCMYANGHRVPVAGQFLDESYVNQPY